MNAFASAIGSANADEPTCARPPSRRGPGPARTQPARGSDMQWLGALATVAFHVAVISFVLWQQQTLTPLTPPQATAETVVVELTLIAEAPRAIQRDLPPGALKPDRVASVDRPAQTSERPPSVVDRKPQATGEKPFAPQTRIELPPSSEPVPATDASIASDASAPAQAAAVESARYAAPQDIAGELTPAPSQWQQRLLGHLQRYKRYPRQARRLHQQGVAEVGLTVDGDGRVLESRIARSSGYPSLDEEALAVVLRASPVPAPPAELGPPPLQVRVPIEFHISGR
ncbi:energy transducer TonB family protein [Pseudomonas sp. CGJS7]|uniref:energy transducer TonB family protein n=1 Tax=Pseudomonas sp. CGJS7 TaxID=3109348 RepID=UPI00300BDD7B